MPPRQTQPESNEGFLQQVRQNRPGWIGFLLSMLQLLVHGSWITMNALLAAGANGQPVEPATWQMWLFTILIIAGAALTMVSLFLCLYGAIHGKPKSLALVGLAVSFFIGMFTTFALLSAALMSR